jgi:hypothetical protein
MRLTLCILTLCASACTANDTQCLPPNKWFFCEMWCRVLACEGGAVREGKLEEAVCSNSMENAKFTLLKRATDTGRVIDCSYPKCGEFQDAYDPTGGQPNAYAEAAAAGGSGDWGLDFGYEDCP